MKENSLSLKLHNTPSAPQIRFIDAFWSVLKQKVYSGKISAKDHPPLISCFKNCALEIDPDIISKIFQNLKAKIHKTNENGLTSLLWYVTYPKSMNYEIIVSIIVYNSLKFELVQFFWIRL